jgi:hypothetical protein
MNLDVNANSGVAKIFGREPAFWVSAIESGLTLLIVFDVLSQGTFSLVFPVIQGVLGLYVAWVTKQTVLSALIGLAKALLSAFILVGWSFTDVQTAAILSFITLLAGAYNRDRTYPLAYPPEPTPGSVPVSDVGAN